MIPTTPTSEVSNNRLPTRFAVGILLLNLLVACIVWFSLQNSKTHYEKRATVTTRNISRVLDEHLSSIFEKVDLALQAVCDEAERQQAGGFIKHEVMNSFIIRDCTLACQSYWSSEQQMLLEMPFTDQKRKLRQPQALHTGIISNSFVITR